MLAVCVSPGLQALNEEQQKKLAEVKNLECQQD